jgi:four helix bundle protein
MRQMQAYSRHLAIADGSLAELETQLEIADRLGYVRAEDRSVAQQANEVGRMLAGLRRSLSALNPEFLTAESCSS